MRLGYPKCTRVQRLGGHAPAADSNQCLPSVHSSLKASHPARREREAEREGGSASDGVWSSNV
jgi:hypothetical protein